MGLHSRLYRSSSLLKCRHNFATSINNPSHHNIAKQSLRLHHDNATNEAPRKFIVGIRPHKHFDKGADSYLSLLSFNSECEYFEPEKFFYFRSPSAPHFDPFSVIGDTNSNNNIVLSTEVFHPPYLIRLVNSCNGLICLQGDTRDGKVVIWNPLIDEFKVLDYSPVQCPRFASHTRFECAGFGFDHKSNDYKALMRVENFRENVDKISMAYIKGRWDGHYEVFSLKTGCWWPLPEPQYEASISPGDSVYMDGFCYWNAKTDHDDDHSFILGFDFADEIFFVFPGPLKVSPRGPHTFSLVDYKGLLGFVLNTNCGFKDNFEFWVREKDGTWSKMDGLGTSNGVKALAWGSDRWFYEAFFDFEYVVVHDPATGVLEALGSMYGFAEKMELIPYVESTTSPINPMEKLEVGLLQSRGHT